MTVELESSNRRATLESPFAAPFSSVDGEQIMGVQWRAVCVTPCNHAVSTAQLLRIGGPGILPSYMFAPPSTGSPLRLRVKAGSTAARTGGALLLFPGFGAATAGAALLIAGASLSQGGSGIERTGAILGIVGAAMLIPGVALFATSTTHVYTPGGLMIAGMQRPVLDASGIRF